MTVDFATPRVPASASHTILEDRCAARLRGPPAEGVYAEPALGFVVSGWFEYRSATGSALAGPGAVVLGNLGETFSVRHLDGQGNRRLVVLLRPSFVEEVAGACGRDDARFGTVALPPGSLATRLFGLMRRLALGVADEEASLYALADAALGADRAGPALDRRSTRDDIRVRAVARHIDACYAEPLTLASLAEAAGLSPWHFTRLFRRATGQSPGRYVTAARLRAAAEMLLETNAPIAQIAFSVGFNDISHFYACFRSTFGRTPRQWRGVRAGRADDERALAKVLSPQRR